MIPAMNTPRKRRRVELAADYTIGGLGMGHGFRMGGVKKTPFLEYGPLAWLRADMGVELSGGYVYKWFDWAYPGRTAPIHNYYTSDPLARKMVWTPPPYATITFGADGQLRAATGSWTPTNWWHPPPFTLMCTHRRTNSDITTRVLVGGIESFFVPYYAPTPASRYYSYSPSTAYVINTVNPSPLNARVSSVLSFDGNNMTGTLRYYQSGLYVSSNTYNSDGAAGRWEESYIGRSGGYGGGIGDRWWMGTAAEFIWLPIAADLTIAQTYETWSQANWQ